MSLINALSGFGGGFFGRTTGATTDTSALTGTGTTGGAQEMTALLKNMGVDTNQLTGSTTSTSLLSGATNTTDTSSLASTGRSIFADSTPQTSGGDSFVSTLNGFINDVNAKGVAAEQANTDIMTGKSDNIHQAMISMQEATISFDLLVQVRNKLVDAYKELSRISV